MGENQILSVYQQVMGHDFYKMPEVFRKMHGPSQPTKAEGNMEIIYGNSILAKICTPFMPIPPKGTYPLNLTIHPHKKGEEWVRSFPKHKMTSIQYVSKGQFYEQFGWSHFAFQLQLSDETLMFNCLGQYLGFIPMPRFLSVRPNAVAIAIDEKTWEMDVQIRLWGILLAQYKGLMNLTME